MMVAWAAGAIITVWASLGQAAPGWWVPPQRGQLAPPTSPGEPGRSKVAPKR